MKRDLLKMIDYALRKDSLCDAERIDSARQLVTAALASLPLPEATGGREAASSVEMNDIVATIADEWGSVLCYNKCSRSNPPIQKCRCYDIANALAADYDIRAKASPVSSTQRNTP